MLYCLVSRNLDEEAMELLARCFPRVVKVCFCGCFSLSEGAFETYSSTLYQQAKESDENYPPLQKLNLRDCRNLGDDTLRFVSRYLCSVNDLVSVVILYASTSLFFCSLFTTKNEHQVLALISSKNGHPFENMCMSSIVGASYNVNLFFSCSLCYFNPDFAIVSRTCYQQCLYGNYDITDEGIACLASSDALQLRKLNVCGAYRISDRIMVGLRSRKPIISYIDPEEFAEEISEAHMNAVAPEHLRSPSAYDLILGLKSSSRYR